VRQAHDPAHRARQVGPRRRTLSGAGEEAVSERSVVAAALAAAFLAEEPWTRMALRDRAAESFAERPPWLAKVVTRVLRRFQEAPVGRLRELARFVDADPNLRRTTRLPLVRRWAAPPTPEDEGDAVSWATGSLPRLGTQGDVAAWLELSPGELAWFADERALGRLVRAAPLRHYSYRWVPKAAGGVRLLEAPKPRIKAIQRTVLRELLDRLPAHEAAHGFRRGRSVRTHAALHAGKAVVLRLDLADFFLTIRAARVAALFRSAGYREEVAFLLSRLCTHCAPVDVLANRRRLAAYASRADIEAWRRAEQLARTRHLPQGAPTSPAVANLVAFGLDVRLAAAARSASAVYTRYADDLVFSGGPELARSADFFCALVSGIAQDEGFVVNERKTRVMGAAARQSVGGLVVNERPRVSRLEADRLKAVLHNCARQGPASQNREAHPDFRAHLQGLVAWAGHGDERRGARLRAMFAEIAWPE
jgi:RNA-directed DNA polymerase